MATRVNTRFVLILAVTLFAAVGIVGGLWVLQIRGDTTRHIKAGDALMVRAQAATDSGKFDDGQALYEQALKQYGRAVAKEPAELSHLRKLETVLASLRPGTQDRARELDDMRVEMLRHEVRYRRQDPEAHLNLITDRYRLARQFNLSGPWKQLADAADDMYNSVSPLEPLRDRALLYRGMGNMRAYGLAGMGAMSSRTASDEDIKSAEGDLLAFVKKFEQDDLGWAALAESQLSIARQLRADNRNQDADTAYEEADETLRQALENVPDGREVARVAALRLVLKRFEERDASVQDDLEAAVDRMEQLAATSDDPLLLADVAEIIRVTDPENGLPRCVELMRAYVDAHPDELYQWLQLAQLCYVARDHDPEYLSDAYEAAELVMSAEPVPVSTLSKIQNPLRIRAAGLIVDVEHRRWMKADEADKAEKLKDIEKARDALELLVAEPEKDVTFLRAEGKIAAARKDFETALAKFEKAVEIGGAEDFETLWNAARCLDETGRYGRALERLNQAYRLRPANVVVLAEKARMEYRVGRFGDALASAKAALAIDPGHQRAQWIKTEIEAQQRRALGETATDSPGGMLLRARKMAEGGDLDAARAFLLGQLEEAEDKLPWLSELIQVEVRAGNTEEALAYVDQALALQPNNQILRKYKVSLSIEDPVEALKQYVAESYDSDAERTIQTLIQLRQLGRELDRRAETLAELEDEESAEEVRARANAAREEAEQFLARATELAPDHPLLLDHLFNEALISKDEQALVELVERARAIDTDPAGGLIHQGRLEFFRGDYERAVQTLTDATARKNWSALAWRLLGEAHERLGNFNDALRAYEEAYTLNPNDRIVVRSYVTRLWRTGDQTRALSVLRAAQRARLADDYLRELRIQLEATHGNPAVALEERRRIYQRSPNDRDNAVRLVALLETSTPTYADCVTPEGERKYSANQWALLSDERRRSELEKVSDDWQKESGEIIGGLEASGADSVEVAALKAETHRARGEVAAGEQVLRDFCESHRDDPAMSLKALLKLGQYQASVNHFVAAAATYRTARAYQTEEWREGEPWREADHDLADLLFNLNRWALAEEVYRELADARPQRGVLLRLAECYLKLEQYEDASAALEGAVADGGRDFVTAMLSAGIADGHGDQLVQQGRRIEADQKYAEASAALDEAERLSPRSPLPHVRRAQRLVGEYQRTRKMTLLDDAMLDLDRAEEAAVGAVSVSRVRVDIYRIRRDDQLARAADLRAKGDERGARAAELRARDHERSAVGELTRLLERTPDNVAARKLLVQIYAESDSTDRALATIEEAIIRNPTIALWREGKGDLLVLMTQATRDPNEATRLLAESVEEFREAHELQPSGGRLAKYAETALAIDPPLYTEVAETVSAWEEFVEGSPLLRSLYARALSGVGRYDEALQQMRVAYREHRQIMERQLLETGKVNPAGLLNWLRSLQAVMSDRGPAEYEQFVTEQAGGRPDAAEQLWAARVWVASGREGLSRGIELVRLALDQCPADDTSLRARLEFDLGQFEVVAENIPAAVAAFERALEIEPDNVLALNNAAYIYAEHMNDPAKALPYAERAVAERPDEATFLDTLGWTYYRVGRHGEAEEYLRRAIKARPTADNHLHLARVLFETTKDLKGQPAAERLRTTRTYLNRAAELQPSEDLQTEIDRLAEEIDAWRR
ncbi:MAG: tetratricopeptide repeat protein [Planctomycetota bacterium]